MKVYKTLDIDVNAGIMSFKSFHRVTKVLFVMHLLLCGFIFFYIFPKKILSPDERDGWNHQVRAVFKKQTSIIIGFKDLYHDPPPKTDILKKLLLTTLLIYPVGHLVVFLVYQSRARQRFKRKTERGSELITEQRLKRRLPKKGLQISKTIRVPREAEISHFFIGGSTRTGKTNIFNRLIEQLRARKAKAIIYDKKDGEFIARFYNPQTDFIFNPLDERSIHLNVFDQIAYQSDFDKLAAITIPEDITEKKFFIQAARNLFAGILKGCYVQNLRSNDDVWNILCKSSKEIYDFIKPYSPEAANSIDNPNSVQTQGVISTMKQSVAFFKYMVNPEKKSWFSLTDWIQNVEQEGFIFLPNNTQQQAAVSPMLSLFTNVAGYEILSLRDDIERRIYLLLDEVGSLQRMTVIKDLVTLGGSKGLSLWLGAQERSQIVNLYGRDLADTIINQCSNYVVFRMNSKDSAKYFSEQLGEQVIEEMESTFSAGVKDYRDGESYRRTRRKEWLVLPSELQKLKKLHYYVKLGEYPVTKTSFKYKVYPDVCDASVPNDYFSADNLHPIKTTDIERYQLEPGIDKNKTHQIDTLLHP